MAAMVPDKKTNAAALDQYNQAFRSSPEYAEFMASMGVDPNGPIRLSDSQREQFKKFLATKGIQLPDGMEIDPAGNLNQNEGVGKYATNPYVLGGIAAGSMLIPGVGPAVLSGLGKVGGSVASGLGKAGGALKAGVAGKGGLSSLVGGGGTFDKIMAGGSLASDILGGGRDMLGSAADTAAHNRGVAMDAQQAESLFNLRQEDDYRRQLIDREQEGRTSGTDALKKIQQAEYIKNAGDYLPPSVPSMGQSRQLHASGFGPKATTETERAGAAGIGAEAMKRLTGGNQLPEIAKPTPFVFEDKDPSGVEKVAQWGVPGLDIFDKIMNQTGGWRKLFGGDDDDDAGKPPVWSEGF